jgi:agmatinase
LRGLDGINLVAADIVEVAVSFARILSCENLSSSFLQPAYDTNAEHTTMAAADALYEIMSIMVKRGPLSLSEPDVAQEDL